jgi:8-oxo-dGTP pyrophosphatase MutT (NUDIX family)
MITFDRDDNKFTFRVAGIAIRNGAVLLQTCEDMGFWVLPGGRCEMGEDAASTLRREMIEEIGCEPVVGPLAWIVENFFDYEAKHVHELGLYFSMTFPQSSPLHDRGAYFFGSEGDLPLIYRWVPLDELDTIVIKPAFISRRIVALADMVEHIVHDDRT